MDYSALIGMVMQLAGSAAGSALSSMDQQQALALIKSTVDEYGKINVPKLQQLALQSAPDTQLANIKDDPAYRAQQASADSQLNDIIDSGGATLADKTALNNIRRKIQQDAAASDAGIQNQMAARGTLDSGATLAMQLNRQQQAANSENQAGENAAAEAQKRAYAAIQQRAQLAGQGLDRTNAMKTRAAQAQDAINQGNIAIANTAQQYNARLGQQDFDNQLKLTGAKVGANQALAGAYGAKAQNTQNQGNALGAVGASAANKFGKDNSGNSSNSSNNYDGSNSNLPSDSTVDQSFGNANQGSDFQTYPGSSGDYLTSESTRSDGSENYEVDPATGKIRRKKPVGQNY